ncbi:hypothetical protein [Metapseudomonas otitidis]|uniref:hypothetical protein n=1 Tax=Metapseudomonas otitidis TaxID=319939 RepID=UPI0013F60822|nr:hypothetical protein [Pseudomonas otitidis]
MRRTLMFSALVIAMSAHSGCTLFGKPAKYDPDVVSAVGTITVSDPKLYSREALINERAREVARIQKLIENVGAVEFKPDVIREIEQISAFSAALGLKFDPAAGLNYRRAEETGDIQQDISALRLQLQLEQLRRDAELLRVRMAEQTEPVNENLGQLQDSGATAAAGGVTAGSVEQLKAQIDRLLSAMTTQLSTAARPISSTTVSTNPFDDFRDRQAYLDMLNSARNAAALDELHDLGNAALIRLNFQATVVPDPENPRSLGAVQVKVDAGSFDEGAQSSFLSEWLDHINTKAGSRTAGKFIPGSDALDLQRLGLLVIIPISTYQVALPTAAPLGATAGIAETVEEAEWGQSKSFSKSLGLLSSIDPRLVSALKEFCMNSRTSNPAILKLTEDVHLARTRILTYEYAKKIDHWLYALGANSGYTLNAEVQYSASKSFISQFHGKLASVPGCQEYAKSLPAEAPAIAWGGLIENLGPVAQIGRARIYEVGPREQVQQLSTMARSANSLALAASIAAAAPGSGLAADAGLGYARQTMERASALERVPSVVGYTVGSAQVFGWVIGPRAVTNSKGRVNVEQMLKPYDLSVDMSVPAWWPKLSLRVTTLWGPSPQQLTQGQLVGGEASETVFILPMHRKAPDYDWYTQGLTGRQGNSMTITVQGGPVNACAPSTLLVTGRNVWRTDKVMILGQLLDRSAITITPDMQGILLNVPAIPPLAGSQVRDPSLHVLTPSGRGEYKKLLYVSTPSGDDCKTKKAELVADPNRVAIESISPDLYFTVPAAFDITVQGKNLDKIAQVMLHGQAGKLTHLGSDRMIVSFTSEGTQSIPPLDGAALRFYKNNGKSNEIVDTRLVRITRQ